MFRISMDQYNLAQYLECSWTSNLAQFLEYPWTSNLDQCLEYPWTSNLAQCFALFSLSMVLISTVTFIISTLEELQVLKQS